MLTKLPLTVILLVPLACFAGLLVALAVFGKVPISYNIRNLVVRWRITAMTALAFTLVVGLMTVMLAFVNGMYRLTASSGLPNNVIVLADGSTDELFSNLGYGADTTQIALEDGVVKDEDGKKLASWEVYCVVNQPIPTRKCPHCGQMVRFDEIQQTLVKHGDPECPRSGTVVRVSRQRRFMPVRGVEEPVISGKVHNLPLYPGGAWFSEAGVQPMPGSSVPAVQCVIGEGLARELGPDQGKKALEVGDYFDLGARKWVVTGIMKSSGSTFDSEVWTKFQQASEQFGKKSYTTGVMRARDAQAAKDLAVDLTKNYKKNSVQARVETEYYEQLNTTNQQFLVAILFVTLVMAIGGVFGIMNTMFAAISQRVKDIGVLRIIGFARWQILVSFFLEALMLALIGGLIGCAVGSLANGWTATSIISSGAGGGKSVVLKMVVDTNILLAGMLFSLVMGAIGGLLPALSAIRLKPLDAVR